jgi:aspartate carbamoyltransferase catalytic subunit
MNLLSIGDLDQDELLELTEFPLPSDRSRARKLPSTELGTLGLLFEQPSLRTMSSFAAAAVRLGLTPVAITTAGNQFRDQTELHDEIHQLSLTSDCVVVRSQSPLDHGALGTCAAPVVNAGDGNNEHPTQTLIDLAVMRHFGLEGRVVAILGNLRDHRTAHSLALALRKLRVDVRLVSPPSLTMAHSYAGSDAQIVVANTVSDRNDAIRDADFVYLLPTMSLTSPDRLCEAAYSIDLAQAERVLRPGAKILHPFPRFGELAKDIDYSSFDAYHLQTSIAPYVRERVLRQVLASRVASARDDVRVPQYAH